MHKEIEHAIYDIRNSLQDIAKTLKDINQNYILLQKDINKSTNYVGDHFNGKYIPRI